MTLARQRIPMYFRVQMELVLEIVLRYIQVNEIAPRSKLDQINKSGVQTLWMFRFHVPSSACSPGL